MAIKELFQDSRPQVLFDPRASRRIDPRFKFTRNSPATYTDSSGLLRYAQADEPRFAYDFGQKQELGLLLHKQATNKLFNSENPLRCRYYTVYTSASNLTTGPITITSSSGTVTAYVTEVVPDGSNCKVYLGSMSGIVSNPATFTQGGSSYNGFGVHVNSGYALYNAIGDNSNFPALSSVLAPDGVSFAYEKASGEVKPNAGTFGNSREIPSIMSVYVKAKTAATISISNLYDFSGYSVFDFSVKDFTTKLPQHSAHYVEELANGWFRIAVESTTGTRFFTSQITSSGSYYFWGFQVESETSSDRWLRPSPYIKTLGTAAVTTAPDLLSIEGTSLPSTGSIYIDARSLSSNVDDTLLSAANASDDKLTLAIREPADLYNSKALVYEVDGAFKPTLPFPVPTDARERNLITYGANNYHYRSDSSRLTPSSSSRVPANMTRLGIGHDVTEPTKAINSYINTVYLWSGEITPTVAEALVRGDVDPKDADGGVFTPKAGALAFIFNTQGAATDGDVVVQLPLRGSTNNVLVDWGDNASSSLIGAAASVTVNHTYPAAGIYPVQITADDDGTNSGLQNLEFYNNSPADLVRVLQWGGTTTWNPTTMYRAFRDCTQLDFEDDARINLPDTSAITNWQEAFYNCSSLSGVYPNFDHSAATNVASAWYNCSSITTFSSSLDDLSLPTNYANAWYGCSSITSFPTITIPDDQGAVNLSGAWQNCTNLQSFPADINTAAVTSMSSTWSGCSSLESFPLINTAAVTTMEYAWNGCSSLDNVVNAEQATSFPLINTSSCTNFNYAWRQCTSLASFPAIDTSLGTNFQLTWEENAFSTFPALNFSSATVMGRAWAECSNLTAFPALSAAQRFSSAMVSGIAPYGGFQGAWYNCTSLTTFPPNIFDDVTNCVRFDVAFVNCALTAQSIENILASINTANTSNGTLNLNGGTNANTSTWSAAANAAYIALVGRGWTITQNGTAPS